MKAYCTVYLPDGIYIIRVAAHPNYVLAIQGSKACKGANICIQEYNGSDAQKWVITDDYFYSVIDQDLFISREASRSDDWESFAGANVFLDNDGCGGWYFSSTSKGLTISVEGNVWSPNDLVLDILGSQFNNGTRVRLWKSNGSEGQIWKPERIGSLTPYVYKGVDYSPVFDPEAYYMLNDEVQELVDGSWEEFV